MAAIPLPVLAESEVEDDEVEPAPAKASPSSSQMLADYWMRSRGARLVDVQKAVQIESSWFAKVAPTPNSASTCPNPLRNDKIPPHAATHLLSPFYE